MYALWIDCCEEECILQNDDNFLSLLQSKIVEHITGKGMEKTEAICRFVKAASSLEDLKMVVDAFVNNAYPVLCKISWKIVSVKLPGEVPEPVPVPEPEPVPEPAPESVPVEHEVLE